MDTRGKMAALFAMLRQEMNGAVTEAMRDRGLAYPLNYGVSIPVIRDIASRFGPDHELAKMLFVQDVRELKLASFSVADPALITLDEADFWAGGLVNAELAGNFATVLLSRTSLLGLFSSLWFPKSEPLLDYTLLLAGAHRLLRREGNPDWEWKQWIDRLPDTLRGSSLSLVQAAEAFLGKLVRFVPESRQMVRALLSRLEEREAECSAYLADELIWQLDHFEG